MDKRKPKPAKRATGNTDLAGWHDRVEARMKRSGMNVNEAAKQEKAAEMRHYRKKKTPGVGN